MKILILMTLFAAACAEVEVVGCYGVDESVCTIHNITIDPCKRVTKACQIKKGENAEIKFDFTPNFSSNKLKTTVMYGTKTWDSLDSDGCKATTCPTVAGSRQSYNVTLHIGVLLPTGTFEVEWSVFDQDNTSNKCCFKTSLKLPRK